VDIFNLNVVTWCPKQLKLTTWLTKISLPVFYYDDDSEGDGVDEIDDSINDSDIDEKSSHYDDHSSVVGAANMDDE